MVDLRKPRFDRPTVLRHVDLLLPVLAFAVAAIGVVMVYSATRGPATELRPAETGFLNRQMVFVGIGAGTMVVTAWIGHRWARRLAVHAYLGLLALLFGVLVAGVEARGSRA